MPFTGWYGKIFFHTEKCIYGSIIIVDELIASFTDFQGTKPVFGLPLLGDEKKIWIFDYRLQRDLLLGDH